MKTCVSKIMRVCTGFVVAAAICGTTRAHELTKKETEFLKNASEMSVTEVELGKLAAENGGSADVKALGKKLAADHKRSNAELSKLAKVKSVQFPMQPNAAQKQMLSAF